MFICNHIKGNCFIPSRVYFCSENKRYKPCQDEIKLFPEGLSKIVKYLLAHNFVTKKMFIGVKIFSFQVVKGGFGARRSKYLRQADPTFAELTEEPPPQVNQNGFNSSKNGYKVTILFKINPLD